MTQRKPIHLGVHFPGVNATTVWSDPRSRSQIEFDSFEYLARRAEDAKFDFFFLAEGLRLREHKGKIFDLDVVGRPDTLPVLSAIAGVTEKLGLAGTLNTTFNEPFEVARQFAALDILSGGRAAWNLVTSPDAFTGENFRRGGYLPYPQRYERAQALVDAARALWDSWAPDAIVADARSGQYLRDGAVADFEIHNEFFNIAGTFDTPRAPQGHPVLFQAGDSADGREFGARTADVIFSAHSSFDEARTFYEDVKGRLPKYGRTRNDLKILPATTAVLGTSLQDAQEKAREIRLQQISGPGAIAFIEQVWGRDLSQYDPEGPLPSFDPDVDNINVTRGRVRHHRDPLAIARTWRELAETNRWSIRELVIAVTSRAQLIGTPEQVADEIDRYVQGDATDGFILVPHLTPAGLDDFFDQVVPILQERGQFRTQYEGDTLRDHLGLSVPQRTSTLELATLGA
ncbi:NtaA/DmoA family FMN-dependent monooxygenase [Populibacterium corticicola]|uniref:NtaA/DmoA family FMN-dependent monooxygenase n=1 Tax=Populibacterium corticicola TaxID=1812826 RepID=A0ABW5XHW2_9MICO